MFYAQIVAAAARRAGRARLAAGKWFVFNRKITATRLQFELA
jgi:hypothetical protein